MHSDLDPAFKAELVQAREEHAVDHERGPSDLERAVRLAAKVSGGAFGLSFAAEVWLVFNRNFAQSNGLLFTLLGLSGMIAVVTTPVYLSLLQRRRDVDTEFWAKLWMGRIGKLAFSIAGKLLRNPTLGSVVTHRATELSLGMAAEHLYETLPRETRLALHDLPELLRRLQTDAQLLRKRYDDLQEALAATGDAGFSDDCSDLRADRDANHDKLGQAVAALETIRLNLLRLHAGSGTVEGLTTHIDLAAEVSAEVERMLAAQEEVERGLTFPREIALSPA
jgi:hypothetical protein